MLPLSENSVTGEAAKPQLKRSSRQRRPAGEGWRRGFLSALSDPARVVFLDVETTGLSWFYDELTIVGWACNGEYRLHVAGDDPSSLLNALGTAHTLVTFNGTLFDLRFLRKTFGDISLPGFHLDLRYLARRAGLTGGQKTIEKLLQLHVRDGVEDLDGAAAVLLWHRYLRGDQEALSRLIDYNARDVVGMCGILDEVLDRLDFHPDLLISPPRFAEIAKGALDRQQSAAPRRHRQVYRAKTRFEDIFGGTAADAATIVGIDLTGSEARPSGWCVLRGKNAVTCKVTTDEEIIARSRAERPNLISIDSPLSIPFGRTSVTDDDPGREQFGIMRQCERELKRRGINVYPCLLPSMQGLTRRGMRLAEHFRSLGVPVIESYPGAAQDIMGIPRKGAGLEYLSEGLADFGIKGSFVREPVSHDELDAITSAIVGGFFLADQFEALRGPTEGALIIPNSKPAERSGMLVVGVSGPICAGKTTIAQFLERHGFAYTRFSLIVDEEIAARGGTLDRSSRQQMGIEIHRTRGQAWLCERTLERVSDHKLVVVDGLRFPEDHAFLAERFGSNFVHLHVTASQEVRARRYAAIGDNLDFEVVERQPVESKVGEVGKLAAVVFQNDSSVAALTERVLNYVEERAKGQNGQCLFRS